MEVFLLFLIVTVTVHAYTSFFNWCRDYCWWNWTYFGVGFAIVLNSSQRWTYDLAFLVPYWVYKMFHLRSTCFHICFIREVPLCDCPIDYVDEIVAHRKEHKLRFG